MLVGVHRTGAPPEAVAGTTNANAATSSVDPTAHRSGRYRNESPLLAGEQQRRLEPLHQQLHGERRDVTSKNGGWSSDTQSFILPFDL
jgi:hypothetical protein